MTASQGGRETGKKSVIDERRKERYTAVTRTYTLDTHLDELETRVGLVSVQCRLIEALCMLLQGQTKEGVSVSSMHTSKPVIVPALLWTEQPRYKVRTTKRKLTSEILDVRMLSTDTLPGSMSAVCLWDLSARHVPSMSGK